ncbi:universal stress protein [Pseudorhodobacter sp. W20_MBD10_FR17]|uniref:universal stress protein n=1 Tax=Pseudorhodobacter sp. W20_MBD10_FR17 TaxID=3240266 RepID=UPI003F9E74EA
MDRNTILIVVGVDCGKARLEAVVDSIPEHGVHASFLVISAAPPMPVWAYGSAPYGPVIIPEGWQESYQAMGQAVADKADEVEQILLHAKVQGDVRSVFCEAAFLDEKIAKQAALCDFVFLNPSISKVEQSFDAALRGSLLQSPVGVVMNSGAIGPVLSAKYPLIAWNNSVPSVKAVHRALPILKQAETVTIAVFDPDAHSTADGEDPGADVASWLSRHGCNVVVQQVPSGGLSIGDCILHKADEMGADLIVMGAYSHSRFKERLLGGTTQTVIEQTRHPLLLAH